MIKGLEELYSLVANQLTTMEARITGVQVYASWNRDLLLGWLQTIDPSNLSEDLHYFGLKEHRFKISTFSWALESFALHNLTLGEIHSRMRRMRTPSYAFHYQEFNLDRYVFKWPVIRIDLDCYEDLFDESNFLPADTGEPDCDYDFASIPEANPFPAIIKRTIISGSVA